MRNRSIRFDVAVLVPLTMCVLGIANSTAAQVVPPRVAVGDTMDFGIGKYVALLSVQDEWFLWERSTPQRKECTAFKVAEGYGWPRFSELGRPTSSAGFWLSWDTLMEYESAGFFGRHWHPRIQVAEIDGEVRRDYHSLESVQAWNGRQVQFEITTTPYRNLWVDRHEDAGTVDFTGFSAILHEFQRCQERLSKQR